MSKTTTYHGDHSARYDHIKGTGTVGKIIGPTFSGKWLVIASATYDPELNLTRVEFEEIVSPQVLLQRLEEQAQEVDE